MGIVLLYQERVVQISSTGGSDRNSCRLRAEAADGHQGDAPQGRLCYYFHGLLDIKLEMSSTRSLSNVRDNFCAACWRDSNADPSLVWSWLLLLHAGGCHQVCHHSWLSSGCLKLSVVLRAVSALLYCRSGCMCCVIISSQLRSFRFCYRELEHSKARAAREKEVVNT